MSVIDFYTEKLDKLVGGRITAVAIADEDEFGDTFYGLIITMQNKTRYSLILLRDDEGNGPGSFELNKLEEK